MAVFKAPFTCIVSGSTSSGKTHWVHRLIEHRRTMIEPPPERVLYCYGELTEHVLDLRKEGILIHPGFPDEETMKELKNTLLVLDDLMSEMEKNLNFLNTVFTRGSHHWGASVIFITQNLYHKDLRMLKGNTHYLVLLRNHQAQHQISVLATQMYPSRRHFFLETYGDATKEPYSYLLVDSHPSTPENERLSTNIFPMEKRIFYIAK
jgi:hypothetical protein